MGWVLKAIVAVIGYRGGAAVKARSDARYAMNPGLEVLRRFVIRGAILVLVVWFLGFGGLHTVFTAIDGR